MTYRQLAKQCFHEMGYPITEEELHANDRQFIGTGINVDRELTEEEVAMARKTIESTIALGLLLASWGIRPGAVADELLRQKLIFQ